MSTNPSAHQQPVKVTAGNFKDIVIRDDDTPVLIDYWAPWCGPCRAMEPVLDALANELGQRALIAKVNIDEEPLLAQATRIRAVPTMHLVQRGKLVDVMLGVQSKDSLRGKLVELTKD